MKLLKIKNLDKKYLKVKDETEIIEKYKELRSSLIIFESGKRIHKTLKLINEVYDFMTEICVCRELTKKYEEIIRFKRVYLP